ncbi:MAG: hypothetical protein ACHQWH_02205 [Nitrososphaerales archaeon]
MTAIAPRGGCLNRPGIPIPTHTRKRHHGPEWGHTIDFDMPSTPPSPAIYMKIVNTDNYARDYPDEYFVNLPSMTKEHANDVANAINSGFPAHRNRYWKVVDDDYKLQPGFEP